MRDWGDAYESGYGGITEEAHESTFELGSSTRVYPSALTETDATRWVDIRRSI